MVWNFGFNDGMGVTHSLLEVDGDIRKIEYVEGPKEWGSVGGGFPPGKLNLGRPIKPDNVPIKFEWGGPKNRKLPDALYGSGVVFASDRLKELIERFEPGVHQFFPIDIIYKSNKELAAKMFFLNICARLDSVDRELTTCPFPDEIMWRPDKGGTLVFNMDQIGNHHLWHDKHIMHGWMISDQLHDAFVAQKITGLVFHKDKTNVEWP
jgi:hypothetical protein